MRVQVKKVTVTTTQFSCPVCQSDERWMLESVSDHRITYLCDCGEGKLVVEIVKKGEGS